MPEPPLVCVSVSMASVVVVSEPSVCTSWEVVVTVLVSSEADAPLIELPELSLLESLVVVAVVTSLSAPLISVLVTVVRSSSVLAVE